MSFSFSQKTTETKASADVLIRSSVASNADSMTHRKAITIDAASVN